MNYIQPFFLLLFISRLLKFIFYVPSLYLGPYVLQSFFLTDKSVLGSGKQGIPNIPGECLRVLNSQTFCDRRKKESFTAARTRALTLKFREGGIEGKEPTVVTTKESDFAFP